MGRKLNLEQKAFIVTAYARFEGTAEIIRSFRERYDLELTHAQANHYNVPGASCNCAPKWKELFQSVRKSFLDNVDAIGIANKTVRIQRLEYLCSLALTRKNVKLAAELMEQAAKEMGEVFTNRREVKSDVRSVTATMTTDELRQEILKDLNSLGIEAPATLQIGVVKDDDTKH
jgi:hypothetical protein